MAAKVFSGVVVLKAFEGRLENLVEGAFARVFRTGLRPVELGRRLVREMDDHRSVGVQGRQLSPNHFLVVLGPDDSSRFADIQEALARELAEAAREHARAEGYGFLGPVEVQMGVDPRLRTGSYRIEAKMKEGEGGVRPGSLALPGNERFILGDDVITIGRLPECSVQLSDPNVSRQHAEIHPSETGFILVDLGSTNGCKINGVRINRQILRDGDRVTMGNSSLTFYAS